LMSRSIGYCTQDRWVYTTSNLEGIAAWLPPGGFSGHPLQLLHMLFQLQLYALPWQVGWHQLGRWLSLLAAIEQAHQEDMGKLPHWLLGVMVVDPASQGKGVGSQLLQPILQRARDEGLPCYLVTFTEPAVGFYQKNGFEILRHQQLGSRVPPFWTLKRDASHPLNNNRQQ
jgi:GNAT superfamily N-acetyltransferase